MNGYLICMIIGLVIPIFSLVADFLDGCVDLISVDLDFLDVDIGDVQLSLLPLSINSICAGLLVFGGIGYLLQTGSVMALVWINVIAIASGYLVAVIVQTMIRQLKKVEHPAYKEKELLLSDAKVINRIPADGLGAVSIELPGSSSVSYPARSYNNEMIPQDTPVEVVEITDGIVVARPKDWLLHKYDATQEQEKDS